MKLCPWILQGYQITSEAFPHSAGSLRCLLKTDGEQALFEVSAPTLIHHDEH
jgi:hypothetical protein